MSNYTPPTPFHSAAVLGRRFLPADAMGITSFRMGEIVQAATKGALMELMYQAMNMDGINLKEILLKGALIKGTQTWFLDGYAIPLLWGSLLEQPTS